MSICFRKGWNRLEICCRASDREFESPPLRHNKNSSCRKVGAFLLSAVQEIRSAVSADLMSEKRPGMAASANEGEPTQG